MKRITIIVAIFFLIFLQITVIARKTPNYKEFINSTFEKAPFDITDAISFSSYGENLGVSIHSSTNDRNMKYILLTENISESKKRLLDVTSIDYSKLKNYPMENYDCNYLKNKASRVISIHYFVEEMVARGMTVPEQPQKAWIIEQNKKKLMEVSTKDVNCPVFIEEGP